jgi:NAD(P)-dependent dehydrogenase (short-subunit alcohol dehydrogenase family)
MDSNFFTDKVYAITGVAGIGFAVAKQLHAYGAKISLADIDAKALADAAQQLGGEGDRLLTTKVDVSSASEVNAWIDATVSKFGTLHGAANMAGSIGKNHGIRPLIEQDDEEFDLIMRVNVYGTKNCLRAELKGIRATAGTGSIVNASSVQGLQGFALHAAYTTSKHAVTGMTRAVAKEEAPAIRVNAIAP